MKNIELAQELLDKGYYVNLITRGNETTDVDYLVVSTAPPIGIEPLKKEEKEEEDVVVSKTKEILQLLNNLPITFVRGILYNVKQDISIWEGRATLNIK